LIVSGTVWPKVNHNFLSRQSNYAPLNCVNKNECFSDSTDFGINLSFPSQDIENFQKHAGPFLIERCAADRRGAPIRQLKKSEPHDYGWSCVTPLMISL
jgi:hypothetical protein